MSDPASTYCEVILAVMKRIQDMKELGLTTVHVAGNWTSDESPRCARRRIMIGSMGD
jgi:hypothetical protein